MRKTRLFLLLLFLFGLLALFACTPNGTDKTVRVTFLSAGGEVIEECTVTRGERLTPPKAPELTCRSFVGWTAGESGTLYDLSSPIYGDLTLCASYCVDYPAWTNRLSEDAVAANVTVETYFGSLGNQSRSLASGVLIALENETYFLLTNAHAVSKDGYYLTEHTVIDCYGNRYTARLNSCDRSYDLAVLYFRKDEEVDLPILTAAEKNAEEGTAVAAIGQPSGIKNVLTYGEIFSYRPLPQKEGESTDVLFDILMHTAPTEHGSSGGALINTDIQLVGINFAVLTDGNGDFCYTAAIPIERVSEYLAAHPFYG